MGRLRIDRLHRGIDRLGRRNCTAAGRTKIAGGISATAGTTSACRPCRQLATAVDTDAIIRVVGDLYPTVYTTHNHSSFLFIIQEAKKQCKI